METSGRAVCHGYHKNDLAAEKMDMKRLPPATPWGGESPVLMRIPNYSVFVWSRLQQH